MGGFDPDRPPKHDLGPQDEDPLALYTPAYLAECASGEARTERLAELRRRIEHGAYRVDAEWLAGEILRRGALARLD